MQDAINIEFKLSSRGKARCAPNPNCPDGCHIDATGCLVDRPYPSPECGAWIVHRKLNGKCQLSQSVELAFRKVMATLPPYSAKTKGTPGTSECLMAVTSAMAEN